MHSDDRIAAEDAPIARFTRRHADALRWIVIDSQGLWSQEDLESEIFLALHELRASCGRDLDPDTEDDATRLLAHLRRIANRHGRPLRKASRLDLVEPGKTPLLERLVADGGEHPLSLLEAAESTEAAPAEMPDPYHSEWSAWHWLAIRFDHRTRAIAEHLMISPSWCRCCRRRAQRRGATQMPLPHGLQVGIGNDAALHPWRRFKLPSRSKRDDPQSAFDYWSRPTQPLLGQMWLL